MTKLEKPVTREARQGERGYPFVVTMHPHGYVEIHLKSCSAERYRVSFETIWNYGAQRAAEARLRERRRAR